MLFSLNYGLYAIIVSEMAQVPSTAKVISFCETCNSCEDSVSKKVSADPCITYRIRIQNTSDPTAGPGKGESISCFCVLQ